MAELKQDLSRITLAVLFIAVLIGASLWMLRPFLPATIWAATLVIATWPIMRRAEARLWNSRALAVTIMTLTLLLLFVVPFWLAIATIVHNASQIAEWLGAISTMEMPPPPSWLTNIPWVGSAIAQGWRDLDDLGTQELLKKATPYAGAVTGWLISAVGGLGLLLVEFLLTVAIAAIMYARGEQVAAACLRFGRRLAGERGVQSARMGAQAIRGVALGVVVTALAQSVVAGIGLVVAGVPFAAILIALVFLLCIAQLGPGLVLIPAIIWMYATQDPVWATVLLIFSILAVTLDNVLRPVLIQRGANLPLLLVLVGVIGGLIAFGLIGLFVGPTILAVGYTLLRAWVDEVDAVQAD
ncbi:MAG TPA: AI-2E family transporter YdiK [Alphaproteobacteria bacterium]|nr:AI-2E family transporter YdiK [Alphaproteobacteria bacterium]